MPQHYIIRQSADCCSGDIIALAFHVGGGRMIPHEVITISRHIMEQQRKFPEAQGEFSGLLTELTLAAKLIARDVRKAGLVNILGLTGSENVHGERVTKLDEYSNRVLHEILGRSGYLCVM